MNIHHLNQTFHWHATVKSEKFALLKQEQCEKGNNPKWCVICH